MSHNTTKKNTVILYIEDDTLNRIILQNLLKVLGYENLLQVENGTEAIALLEKSSANVDLIFMDLGLPDIDGITLAKKIRASDWNVKHVPIIAITGNAAEFSRDKSLVAGMNDFVTKPVDLEVLRSTIEKFITPV